MGSFGAWTPCAVAAALLLAASGPGASAVWAESWSLFPADLVADASYAALDAGFDADADPDPEPSALRSGDLADSHADVDPALPSAEELMALGATIGRIEIHIGNIFDTSDPRENRALFRVANKLHRRTRPRAVLSRLLFRPGDLYDPRVLTESERVLRAGGNFYDAEVLPLRYHPATNEIDVIIRARDVWTLTGGFQFNRSGGQSTAGFKLKDDNFLGTGKSLQLKSSKEIDRDVGILRYFDPNVLGSRWLMKLQVEDNSDGDVYDIEVARPFVGLDSRRAIYFRFLDEQRGDPFYDLGKVRLRFRHKVEIAELSLGWSRGLKNHRVNRYFVGLARRADFFTRAPSPQPSAFIPADRELVYPFFGFSSIADRFEETRDFDQIARTEDVELGFTVDGSVGLARTSFGGDRDALLWNVRSFGGFRATPRQTGRFDISFVGRIEAHEGLENVIGRAELRYYARNFGENLFYVLARGDMSWDLDRERQILLGGDNGLRGYPLRYQAGERSVLLTLEQRFFTDWYPFRLAYVGAAVFFDIGRTFTKEIFYNNQGWLKDVGVGLRLSSSRSGFGSVIHFDLAFPLDGDPTLDSIQWLVSTKNTF